MTVATYKNLVTKETYELGMDIAEGETALSQAWNMLTTAAALCGWHYADMTVISYT